MAQCDELLARAKEISTEHGLTLQQLGRAVLGNHKFFIRLEAGHDCTTRVAAEVSEKLERFAAARQADGTEAA